MAEPIIAQKGPYSIDVKSGRTYYWCACGRSAKQPFCDGGHKAVGLEPLAVEAEATKTMHFCGCKRSNNKPFCDGTHSKL